MTWIDSGSGPGWSSPIPAAVERAEMRSVMLAHLVVGGVCRSCGQQPGRDGLCFAGRVAFERLAQDDRT